MKDWRTEYLSAKEGYVSYHANDLVGCFIHVFYPTLLVPHSEMFTLETHPAHPCNDGLIRMDPNALPHPFYFHQYGNMVSKFY